MRYVANIEIDLPGFEEVAEWELEIDGDVDHDMSDYFVSDWSIETINGVPARNVPIEVYQAVKAQLDTYAVEQALIEHYYGG